MSEEEIMKKLEATENYDRLIITPTEWEWVFRHEYRLVFVIFISVIGGFGLMTFFGHDEAMDIVYGGLTGFGIAALFVWQYFRGKFDVAPELPTYRSDLVTSIRQEAEEVVAAILPIVKLTGRIPFPIQIADVSNCRHITADIAYNVLMDMNEAINSGD